MGSADLSFFGVEDKVVAKVAAVMLESIDSNEQPRSRRIATKIEPTSGTLLTGPVTTFKSLGSRSTQSGIEFPVRRLHSSREKVQQFLESRS